MLKRLLAIVLGLAGALALTAGSETLQHLIWPVPKGLKMDDVQALTAYVQSFSTIQFVALIVTWSLAMLTAVFITVKIATPVPRWPSVVVILLFASATAANFKLVPHPVWVMGATAMGFLLAISTAFMLAETKKR
jgi:hypothetical protein